MADNENNNQIRTGNKNRPGIWSIIIISIVSLVMFVIVLAWATNGWANWNPEEWFNSWGAAQSQPDDTEHAHTFDTTKWESDEKNHWHAATCGHNIIRDTAAHTYENNICKVCGYKKQSEPEPHVHTYDMTKWESDSVNHWRASTCGHEIIGFVAAHNYSFGKCAVCGYEKPVTPHTHTYDGNKWVNDDVNHWHASNCGHNIVIDMAAHTYKDGVCTVCAYINTKVTSHQHSFDESVWDYDFSGHWHPSSCGHNVTSEPEAHKLVKGKCACGFEKMSYV